MKLNKTLAVISAMAMLTAFAPVENFNILNDFSVSVSARTLDNGLTYEQFEGSEGITITGCDKNVTEIEIPAEIDGVPVTNICNNAFDGCSSLTKITIPDSVANIGWGAFENTAILNNQNTDLKYIDNWLVECSNKEIEKAEIKEDTKGIAEGSFSNCETLTSVTIPNSVTTIGGCAFSGCISLTEITIPDSVTYIGYEAFCDCKLLANVNNLDSVINISEDVFKNTAILNNQDTDLKYIDNWLVECSNKEIKKAEIKEGTRGIAICVFGNCTSLTEVIIPNSVVSIGGGVFNKCTSLTEVIIPNSVTSIGTGIFYGCTSLNSVTLPDFMETIGYCTFLNCNSLEKITIPNSVTSIHEGAFGSCKSLTEVIIPDSVTSIYDGAFSGCKSLTEVTIPDSVVSIGSNAFDGCKSLTNVTIPDSVTSIGEMAFGYYYDTDYVKVENFTIKGVKGSAAETYATENEFIFVEIEGSSTETVKDIDGDGEITTSDALSVLKFVSNVSDFTDEQKKLADLDGDGEVTSYDALIVLQHIVGLE